MKKSSTFLKHIISLVTCIAKAKSMAIKGKADAVKTRLVVFSLLKNKKLSLGGISHKIHAILGQQDKNHNVTAAADDDSKAAIVVYNAATDANDEAACSSSTSDSHYLQYKMMMHDDHDDDVDDKYPDLTHSLFDELDDDDELGDPNASVIELVRNSKEEGQDFRLEDEIDQVADLFIKKFHKRMRMQKLESFKRYQEMLERST